MILGLTAFALSSSDPGKTQGSSTPFIPPTIDGGDLILRFDCGLTIDQHRMANKWICDLLGAMGTSPSPQRVVEDLDYASYVLCLLLRTASPYYRVKPEYRSLDNLRALAEHNEELRHTLADALIFRGFNRMRSLSAFLIVSLHG